MSKETRRINRKYPKTKGYERAWMKCEKCKMVQYYDYVPYSLSNPIMTAACNHMFSDLKHFNPRD